MISEKETINNDNTTIGEYTKEQLLRRVTLTNLLFESDYYNSVDVIMNQIENLVPKVDPSFLIELAYECRFQQKLRHTPLWLLLLGVYYFKNYPVKFEEAIAKVCTRPDQTMDILCMHELRNNNLKPVPNKVKKGLRLAFNNYDDYQIAKYKSKNHNLSLVDVVNIVHPRPTEKNEEALNKLVRDELKNPGTWENRLSSGEDKAFVFSDMIEKNELGSLAILRNIRNMKQAGISNNHIKKAISQVNSYWLTPLNFLAAYRIAPEFNEEITQAMKRCFNTDQNQISGKTILAIDMSGSMGYLTSNYSLFSRLDLAFALVCVAKYIFQDLTLVFTAGNDMRKYGYHMVYDETFEGFDIFNKIDNIKSKVGNGGIFTYQLCEWLKDNDLTQDADRLVVISDSQDVDVLNGTNTKKPDVSPYKTSYILDISSNTHGIKTDNWTAEIQGWSDKLFHYIKEVEKDMVS